MSENCRILWIPNTYFDGYFPQKIANTHKVPRFPGRFHTGDKYIDEIMEKSDMNPDIEAILDKISKPDFIPTKTIQAQIDASLAELKRREWLCEVKISDYVEDNMFGNRLFYSPNHPITQGMMEIARRILRVMGMRSEQFLDYRKITDDSDRTYSLIGMDIPIYPSVLKFFDIVQEPETYYANTWHWDFHDNFRGFLRAYIRQCWSYKFTK